MPALFNVDQQREILSLTLKQAGAVDPGKAPGRPRDFRAEQALRTMEQRHSYSSIMPATLINLLPSQLRVCSPMAELSVIVPPAHAETGYSHYTWAKPTIEWATIEGGVHIPNDWMPLQMAEQFLREYQKIGGVFAFLGTIDDFDPQGAHKEPYDRAREAAVVEMQRLVGEANEHWNTPQHAGNRNITNIHRLAVQWLFDRGRYTQAFPAWYEITPQTPEHIEACPVCKTVPKAGAVECGVCANILNPAAAYMVNRITEDHMALEKLTRAEVEELGISAFVAETADEKPARLKAGLAKPLSLARRNQLAAEKAQEEITKPKGSK